MPQILKANAWTPAAILLAARLALAALFLLEGLAKVRAYAPSVAYMERLGVPGVLLPAVIALEIGGGLAIVAGWRTQWVSLALGAFCIAAAVIFHSNLSDHGQALHFWKDLAIAGGFLALAAAGAGSWSLDLWLERQRRPLLPAGQVPSSE